jgi:hypothetical protein
METVSTYLPTWTALFVTGTVIATAALAGRTVAAFVTLAILLVSLCINWHVALLTMLLLGLTIIGALFKLKWKPFAITTLVITVGVSVFVTAMTHDEITRLEELRLEYPLISVADRLAYEESASPPPPVGNPNQPFMSLGEGTELRRFRESLVYEERRDALASLHQRTYEQFVLAPGFGIARMEPRRPEIVRLPEASPVVLTCTRPESDPSSVLSDQGGLKPPEGSRLQTLHWQQAGDFLSLARMGYLLDRDHVAWFEPHALSRSPAFSSAGDEVSSSDAWQVTKLELVSLLKHSTPRVYESEYLPNMEQLASEGVPTRELDEFEAAALPQLRTERDVVIDAESRPGTIRMLGSLRADTECIQCHNVRRGDLLGAFSYRLQALAFARDGRVEQEETEATETP